MKYYLIVLIFFSLTAKAQVPFGIKFKECTLANPCIYCGDTQAYYKRSLRDRIQRNLEQGPVRWMSTGGRILFEICVDSTGHSCVHSIKDETNMVDIRENVRRCINNLWDWTPASSGGQAINSTVILELHFIGNIAHIRFVKPEETQ